MEVKREIKKWGETSLVFAIPPDLCKYLEIEAGDEIVLKDEEGKHGRFVTLWKKKVENNEKKEK